MRARWRALAGAVAALWVVSGAPARAQEAPSGPADAAALDGLVAAHDWPGLRQRLSPDRDLAALTADLAWEKAQVLAGKPVALGKAYVDDLWRAASLAPPEAQEAYRRQAVAFALQEFEVYSLDGEGCPGFSFAVIEMQRLALAWTDILAYAQAMAPADQAAVRAEAAALVRATADLRGDDPLICEGNDLTKAVKASGEGGPNSRHMAPRARWARSYAYYDRRLPGHLEALLKAPIPTPSKPASAVGLSDNPWNATRALTDEQAEAAIASLDLTWRPSSEPFLDRDIVDGYLALRNWTALTQRLSTGRMPDDLEDAVRWEQAWIDHGGPMMLDVIHVGHLWTLARFSPAAEQPGIRRQAVVYALYSLAVTELDGLRCADVTAPAHRREQMTAMFKLVIDHGRRLSAEDKARVKADLVEAEARTAPLRGEDLELCSNGLAQSLAALDAGTAQKQPTPPGGFGQTYALTAPAGYRPQYRPEAEWRAELDRRRARLGELADAALGGGSAKP